MKKLLIFAGGTTTGGGSGFQNLVKAVQENKLHAEIVGVVSNHEHGGVREKADRLDVPFIFFPGPWTAEEYQRIAKESGADFFALSGWIRPVAGLDLNTSFNSKTVFNIHPGPLPKFGGKGMYGHYVHEAVLAAHKRGELSRSEVSIHFVTEEYDQGPVFMTAGVWIYDDDTPATLAKRVNKAEHEYQPLATEMIISGSVTWDGVDPKTMKIGKAPQN